MFHKGFVVILTVFLGLVLALIGGCTRALNPAPYLTPPSAPALSTPANESIVHTLWARLEWQSPSGAISYGLQISTDADFTNLVDERIGIANAYQLVLGLKNNTTYYWRINTSNVVGTSTWSQSWKFTTSVLQLDNIAFSSNRTGNWDIYVMNSDGANQVEITNKITGNFNTIVDDICTSWSPDGTKIAFDSRVRGMFDIYKIDTDGNNVSMLTTNQLYDRYPAWSPDGSKIAFVSSRSKSGFQIYIMGVDGSNQVRLTDTSATDLFPSWSPDGTKIAFTSTRDDNDGIYVMNSDGSNQTRITNNSADDRWPVWR